MAGVLQLHLAVIMAIFALSCVQPSTCAPFNWDKVTLTKQQEAVIGKVDALLNTLLKNILEEYKRANPNKKFPAFEDSITDENDTIDGLMTEHPSEIPTDLFSSNFNSQINTEMDANHESYKYSSLTDPPSAVTTLKVEEERNEYDTSHYGGEAILFPLYRK